MLKKDEIHRLTQAIAAAGDSFASRRVLDRLMAGEVALADAIRALEVIAWTAVAKA